MQLANYAYRFYYCYYIPDASVIASVNFLNFYTVISSFIIFSFLLLPFSQLMFTITQSQICEVILK